MGIHRSFHLLRSIEYGGAPRLAQTHELGPCKFHLRPLNFWKVESEAGAFRVVLQPLKIDSARGAAEHPNIAQATSFSCNKTTLQDTDMRDGE